MYFKDSANSNFASWVEDFLYLVHQKQEKSGKKNDVIEENCVSRDFEGN